MTVYVSAALRDQYPYIYKTIWSTLLGKGIGCNEINSNNLWARDYMPIKTGSCYTKFKYKRNPKYPWLEVNSDCWQFVNAMVSYIYLDGGNVVQDDDVVIMTEQVFNNNPSISRVDLTQFLKDRFEKKIIFIPVEPGDTLGHSDGIVKLLNKSNNKTAIINDHHNQTFGEYSRKLETILNNNGIECIRMPFAYKDTPRMTEIEFRNRYPLADDYEPGFGYYINWYQVDDVIFYPTFGLPKDDDALLFMIKHFPGYNVIPVDCRDLSMLGGLLNCITYEVE